VLPAQRVRGPAAPGAATVRAGIALAVLAVAVLLLGFLWASGRDAPPVDDPNDVVRIGVVQGQSVAGYLRSSRAELAALTDPSAPTAGYTWALVSLDDYVPPGSLPTLLAGTAVAEVYTRVPLAAAHTQVVRIPVYRLPADAISGMLAAALTRDREQAEYRQLERRARSEGGRPDRAVQAYEAAAATAATEAAAYRSSCSCVFAAVIRGASAALREVARRPGVRAVDPAPEVRRLDRTEFRPPLPEQTGTVPLESSSSPAVPNADSGIASHVSAPILSSLGVPVRSTSRATLTATPICRRRPSEERSVIPSAPNATAARYVSNRSLAAP
jgi:hypothetical protein